MEREYFVPVAKRVGLALAATALVSLGVACIAATQGTTSPTSPESGRVSAIETPALNDTNIIKTGQWAYMPGAHIEADGLHVEYRGFQIVQQDGLGGQPNSPVNEYGTHLDVPKDFTLQFQIGDIKGPASLQFYESPPIISDEFRVEPKSIQLTFDGTNWTMKRWNGQGRNDLANQLPVMQQSFATPQGGEQIVKLLHKNGTVALTVNGKLLGNFDAADTFANGQLWFGADAEAANGHFTIKNMEAIGSDGDKVTVVDTTKAPSITKATDGLQALATKRRPGFLIGADIAQWASVSNQKYHAGLYGGNFGIVTPENVGKREFIEYGPGKYDFRQLDALVAEARKNNVKIHGHNLVFSEALPAWLQTMKTDTSEQKAQVRTELLNFVTALVGRYKGVIDEWDVNELFADYDDDGNLSQVFRDNIFYRAMGSDYVSEVINAAHKANAKVDIWINEYGMETDDGARWQAALGWIKKWKQQGLPVYGFGFQAHIYDTGTDLIVNEDGQALELKSHIQQLGAIGIKSRISELDAPADPSDYDVSSQSEQFVGVFKTCIELPSCEAVSFWSLGPTDVWQDGSKLESDSVDSIFDQQMKPTPAYYAVQQYLRTGN